MNVLYGHNLVIEALCWLIAVKKQRGVGAVCGCPSVCLGVVHGAITPVIAHGSVWPQAESHPSEQQTHTFSCMCRITSPSGGLKVKNYFLNLSADYFWFIESQSSKENAPHNYTTPKIQCKQRTCLDTWMKVSTFSKWHFQIAFFARRTVQNPKIAHIHLYKTEKSSRS